jgi:hypothetical protein
MSPTSAAAAAAGAAAAEPAAGAAEPATAPPPAAPRRSWVTYADNRTHFDGALVMYRSLVDAGTRYPFLIMVPEACTLAVPPALAAAGPGVSLRRVGRLDRGGANFAFERYAAVLNKLWLWTLTEFEKVGRRVRRAAHAATAPPASRPPRPPRRASAGPRTPRPKHAPLAPSSTRPHTSQRM